MVLGQVLGSRHSGRYMTADECRARPNRAKDERAKRARAAASESARIYCYIRGRDRQRLLLIRRSVCTAVSRAAEIRRTRHGAVRQTKDRTNQPPSNKPHNLK